MSQFKLRVNGKVEFDGTIGEWTQTPPDFVKDRIKSGAVPEGWMKAVMIVLADTVMANKASEVTVKTKVKNGVSTWSLEVEERDNAGTAPPSVAAAAS